MSAQHNLMERSVGDDNFGHLLTMAALSAAWADGVEEGYVLTPNDLNMIAFPAEVAMAFIKNLANDGTDLGAEAHKAMEMFEAWRSARKSSARKQHRRVKTPIGEAVLL